MSMSILGYDTGASRGGGEVLESFWQRASSHSLAYITEAAAQHHHQHHTGGVAEAEASHNNIQQITKNQRTSHRYTQSDTDSIWLFCIRILISIKRREGTEKADSSHPSERPWAFLPNFFCEEWERFKVNLFFCVTPQWRCPGGLGGLGPSEGLKLFLIKFQLKWDSSLRSLRSPQLYFFSNRSGIHLDGSSFRLSSSRNQSDDDSSDTKPGVCLLQYGQWHELIIPSLLWKFLYELSCYSCYSCYPDMSSVVTASSTTRSFLRMRPSSGNSSDGGKKTK